MSFLEGLNRPPRRQSAKNIDFRRLADVNNDDDDADDKFLTFKSCNICQKILNDSELESLVRFRQLKYQSAQQCDFIEKFPIFCFKMLLPVLLLYAILDCQCKFLLTIFIQDLLMQKIKTKVKCYLHNPFHWIYGCCHYPHQLVNTGNFAFKVQHQVTSCSRVILH